MSLAPRARRLMSWRIIFPLASLAESVLHGMSEDIIFSKVLEIDKRLQVFIKGDSREKNGSERVRIPSFMPGMIKI